MSGKLQREIQQTKPFPTREAEAFLNLQRSADFLMQRVSEALKPAGLTPTQYNILRILRGAGPDGLACRDIGERLITRDPDLTRLLDRMEQRGLVARSREDRDRRVVTVRIAAEGLETLNRLDQPLQELQRKQFQKLDEPRIQLLIELLESLRD
jgi:MarR family transcriptional regulator, organic hydroperoxide resistance regulator